MMRSIFHCYGKEPSISYDFGSMQIDIIKQLLPAITDEALLNLHGDAYLMHTKVEATDKTIDAAELLEDTLSCLPHLDAGRAVRIYKRLLDDENILQETREFVPSGLLQLTLVVGDRSLPLWRQIFQTEADLEEDARLSANKILKQPDTFNLSEEASLELSKLSSIG